MARAYRGPRVNTSIRIPIALHGRLAHLAADRETSMNDLIMEACNEKIERELGMPAVGTRYRANIHVAENGEVVTL